MKTYFIALLGCLAVTPAHALYNSRDPTYGTGITGGTGTDTFTMTTYLDGDWRQEIILDFQRINRPREDMFISAYPGWVGDINMDGLINRTDYDKMRSQILSGSMDPRHAAIVARWSRYGTAAIAGAAAGLMEGLARGITDPRQLATRAAIGAMSVLTADTIMQMEKYNWDARYPTSVAPNRSPTNSSKSGQVIGGYRSESSD